MSTMTTSPRRRKSRSEWVLQLQAFEDAAEHFSIKLPMLFCSDLIILKCLGYSLSLVNLEVDHFLMWMVSLCLGPISGVSVWNV
jgi:hypothetical protein